MQLKPILITALILALFSSCSHVYTPALYHQDIAYQPKPASFDSVKFQTYVSGGLNLYANTDYTDFLTSGQLNISQGAVFNHFNLAYGVFGAIGNYNNSRTDSAKAQNTPANFSNKYFAAVGGRLSANYFFTKGRFDFRIIGFEAAYSHESGSFADFRKSIISDSRYDDDPRTDLFSIGLTSEILFHNTGDINFQNGIRGFLGTTFGKDDVDINSVQSYQTGANFLHKLYPKISYFIKYKNYFGTIETGNGLFIRAGLQF